MGGSTVSRAHVTSHGTADLPRDGSAPADRPDGAALPQPRVSRRAPSAASVRCRKAAAAQLPPRCSARGGGGPSPLRNSSDGADAAALPAGGDRRPATPTPSGATSTRARSRPSATAAPTPRATAGRAARRRRRRAGRRAARRRGGGRRAPRAVAGAHRAAEIAAGARRCQNVRRPRRSARAASLPFRVHVGCLGGALDLGALRTRSPRARRHPPGSAVACRAGLESRLTARQFDAGVPFEYAGKVMAGGALTPHVAAARDRTRRSTGGTTCS